MTTHVGRRAVAARTAAAQANSAPVSRFSCIQIAVGAQFERMMAFPLFRTDVEKDKLWDTYLASFPPGTNPIYRKRTEHDCACCRQFIRAVGNVVAVMDGTVVSIWDVDIEDEGYRTVAGAMSALVKAAPLDNVLMHTEASVGTARTFEEALNGVQSYEHFHIRLPNSLVMKGKDIGPHLSEARALHDVLLRSLSELKMEAVDTVLELIDQNSIYRGSEHRFAVAEFKKALVAFGRLATVNQRDAFAWTQSRSLPASVSKIRNTSIGTLLVSLSEGEDVDKAVRAFEALVAPTNYKRPTALVTKAMIDKAKETVAELGLTTALERRYATLLDIGVNNVLFADRSARKAMAGDVFEQIAAAAPVPAKKFDRIEEISIEKFLADVLPNARTLEMLMENRLTGNLVSLIAPADATARQMFKWPNRFSWSYVGDFADSIKERVKRAGGSVTGVLCCRLAWYNHDDLDLHMIEPDGTEICYHNKRSVLTRGNLDVDMNAGRGTTREPVENIAYPSEQTLRQGTYTLFVHQFNARESDNVGFDVEIDYKGRVRRYAYPKRVTQGERIIVAKFDVIAGADDIRVISSLPEANASKKVWGLDTEAFQRVNVVMRSPNHWDGHGVGNLHHFFMLAGCANDGTARGFYNEFLTPNLDKHRKVFEMVGSKMRTEEADNQLSGLGFSSTQRNHAIVRVTGATERVLRIAF